MFFLKYFSVIEELFPGLCFARAILAIVSFQGKRKGPPVWHGAGGDIPWRQVSGVACPFPGCQPEREQC